ncbi:30S ribosomal protein S4 [Candidatus Dojkabacteria bacterium]|nr:30S ribosomal protein S4 [Candidatus Dojkabacteria bacterium]
MGRYTGPKGKLSRREGVELHLKGARSFSEKSAIKRKPYEPGQHGNKRRVRLSEYGMQLREKQKVKRIYGLRERQFKNLYEEAVRLSKVNNSDKGYELLKLLERRLDNVVYLSGLAASRSQARQYVTHKHVLVNGKVINIPSYPVKIGDTISLKENKLAPGEMFFKTPLWISKGKNGAKVEKFPDREMIDEGITESLIIEFYSR